MQLSEVTPVSVGIEEDITEDGVALDGEVEIQRRLITYGSVEIYRTGIFRAPMKPGRYTGACANGGCQVYIRSTDPRALALAVSESSKGNFVIKKGKGRQLTATVVNSEGVPQPGVVCHLHGRDTLPGDAQTGVRWEVKALTDSNGKIEVETCGRFHELWVGKPPKGEGRTPLKESRSNDDASIDFGEVTLSY